LIQIILWLSLVLPLVVESHPVYKELLPVDCEDIFTNGSKHSGVYTIFPAGRDSPVQVWCDMGCDENDSHTDGKWTVIQRRMDGTVNFYRPWDQYKKGFGNVDGEYWLGLESIFMLTWRGKYELKIDMEDFEKGQVFARYSSFSIDPESDKYRLHVSGYIDGGAGDSLSHHNGRDFATFDRDYGNCAKSYEGGFWFSSSCVRANPNGLYKWGSGVSSYSGVQWYSWKGSSYSLKTMVMKIRRVSLDEFEK
ncbi:microfibril-associated glycoprotein 4-like, partial [Chanos chanos]|uniref:Microfibril-associated glycoprotein 4-like n=1 Tax=Chanos chanos TaxID=29144 RepID=A0A6J2VW75_CHACN